MVMASCALRTKRVHRRLLLHRKSSSLSPLRVRAVRSHTMMKLRSPSMRSRNVTTPGKSSIISMSRTSRLLGEMKKYVVSSQSMARSRVSIFLPRKARRALRSHLPSFVSTRRVIQAMDKNALARLWKIYTAKNSSKTLRSTCSLLSLLRRDKLKSPRNNCGSKTQRRSAISLLKTSHRSGLLKI